MTGHGVTKESDRADQLHDNKPPTHHRGISERGLGLNYTGVEMGVRMELGVRMDIGWGTGLGITME